jgi:hypothetical protein
MGTAAAHRPRIHCSSEWHLRESPRAIAIYHLALRLTKGGKDEFFLSQPQLATYFDWDIKTVREAFAALRESGLFKLLRGGFGGEGQANFANVYAVITHSKLPKTDHWTLQEVVAHSEQELVGEGKTGRGGLPETGRGVLPETGTLVYELSTNKSTSPSPSDETTNEEKEITPGLRRTREASLRSNPNRNPIPIPIPEPFEADENNRRYAMKNGLNLQWELDGFVALHGSIGNERKNWQAVFRRHLIAAAPRGRIALPDWLPAKEWTAYLDMRERIGRPATKYAQGLVIKILDDLRAAGQEVAAVLSQSTANEFTGVFRLGTGPHGKRLAWVTTGTLSENVRAQHAAYAAKELEKTDKNETHGLPGVFDRNQR